MMQFGSASAEKTTDSQRRFLQGDAADQR